MTPSSATAAGSQPYHNAIPQFLPPIPLIPQLSYPNLRHVEAQTTAQIYYWLRYRAQTRRRSNYFLSFTYRLPVEILSLIFQFACPFGFSDTLEHDVWEVEALDRHAVVLSCVSAYWRQVALTTPQLWTSIELHVSRDTVLDNAALLQHHFTHAGNLCISVLLFFKDSALISSPGEQAQHMRAALTNTLFSSANAQKIGALLLDEAPTDWLHRLKELPLLCALRIHHLHPQTLEIETKLEVHSPALHTLLLSRLRLDMSSLKLPHTIRILRLVGTNVEANRSLLYNCPSLIECHAFQSHVGVSGQNSPRFFDTPLVFRHLEAFSWDISDGIDDGSALENLHLPTLKRLHLTSAEYEPPVHADDRMIVFIHKHSGTLAYLELEGLSCLGWDGNKFEHLFQHDMPLLQTIHLTEIPLEGLLLCLQALTPEMGLLNRERIPVPRLKDLLLAAGRDDDDPPMDEGSRDNLRSLGRLTLEMLRARRAGESSEFHIEIFAICEFEQDVREGLRSLCLGGDQVTLMVGSYWEDSEIPDWLE